LTDYSVGGIPEYIQQLSTRLPKLDTLNEYLVLNAVKTRQRHYSNTRAKMVKCWTPAHHVLERYSLTLELLPRNIHLLHSPDFIPPRGGPWKSVITIHDLSFLLYPHFLTPDSQKYYNYQIQHAVRRADAILADSNTTRNDILEYLSVKPEKVTTVYLAPHERFQPQPTHIVESTLSRLKLPSQYLLFVGTFEPRKNINGLLEAYSSLISKQHDTPQLIMIGRQGWLDEPIESLLHKLNLQKQVHILTNVDTQDLPAIYTGALALLLPSHYEGFGFPVLESMSCGTAAIISDKGSLPEIAGDAALQCNPNSTDSIEESISIVLTDSKLRKDLEQKGIKQSALFTWHKCCQQTLDVYNKVLQST
ncbi:MAG: glycosyltransferase family 1 protein, partial [Chloroflexota bacterium]|nr:glycosyltransferase family 1 protein [Chloroflexota bacterium]